MILDDITESTKVRLKQKRAAVPFKNIRSDADTMAKKISSASCSFESALSRGRLQCANSSANKEISFICEVKKASPSKGIIVEDFPYLQIAKDYKEAGAAAISVLTESDFFKGSPDYLKEIANKIELPVLCKDFIIDPYQIYEAKTLGAAAVLLICTLLDDNQLRDFLDITHSLKMSALVETHNESEVEKALCANAKIIGVNNRDLTTFNVDLRTSLRLRKIIPNDKVFVAESGISTAEEVKIIHDIGADAILIGEAMMKSYDKKLYLKQLRSLL
ncbi:MAG: indole-3-glycerol phosphate synthase TrpC [Termitinemataceae bacterium]|nr:MAG: indole-3-glycerol phosphate synthase TrpC [Termitinemataceae bacterium]